MTQKIPPRKSNQGLDARLAAYVAVVAAAGGIAASQSDAAVIVNNTVQPFGVNGDVNIDFNSDGQIDFQIDHDRVDLGGGNNVDYLQMDKNDASSAGNPFPINVFATFPPGATTPNDTTDAAYIINPNVQGSYPASLTQGAIVGPASSFDFSEGDNFLGTGKTIRANRLIDEDATQVDQVIGGLTTSQVQVPFNGPNFVGLGGEVRYLGVRMGLNNAPGANYGWIGIRIDNEADATGAVVGYGYETTLDTPITIPEPGGALMMIALLASCTLRRRFRRGTRH